MSDVNLCILPGCDKSHYGHGWCRTHYRRWKTYGDPIHRVRRPSGEALRYFNEVVLAYEGDECLMWPFTCHTWGYGQLWVNGKNHAVHILICERQHGSRPSPRHDAAHSCGKGHLGCVTKGHLDWKTKKQNQADRLIHGTHGLGEQNASAKLTEVEVREILSLKGSATQREIAGRFGIGRAMVGLIHQRKSWSHIASELESA